MNHKLQIIVLTQLALLLSCSNSARTDGDLPDAAPTDEARISFPQNDAELDAHQPDVQLIVPLDMAPAPEDMAPDAAMGGMGSAEVARLEQIAAGYGKSAEEVSEIVSIVEEFMGGGGADVAEAEVLPPLPEEMPVEGLA